ncbi:unnamed protein product [Caenorhabditis bovis]|uniref:C-type lectin domain-containing protein n=1 Tax=Caenorhabditis bovis TaxID=2654633 RepID=A0A8S1EIJ0_9PELO|nr:unnamed protein product [Caenorhabditis bovis]
MRAPFIITASLIISLAQASCPSGTKVYNGKCYAYLGTDFDRNTSLSICQQTYGYGARLLTPLTAAENKFATEQVQVHASWHTWLEFIANGQYFVGDDGVPPRYTNFAVGEPFRVERGYCLTIGMNGFWYAQPCAEPHSALCEFDSNPKTTKKPPTTITPKPGYPTCVQKYLNFVPCANGWQYHPPSCSCFIILSNITYYNAMNTCRSLGGRLASVHNFAESAFIQRIAYEANSNWISTGSSRDNIIVGLTVDNGYFKWDDLTPFDFYEGFAPGEPSATNVQGQVVLNNPVGYATYMRMADCSYQTCRYAACRKYVF